MADKPPEADWRRADGILSAVLDCPADERQGRAARLCGDDEELRLLVFELLEAAEAESVLESGPWAGPLADELVARLERAGGEPDAPERRLREQPQQIGPYRVLRELGRGGMAVVYLAEPTGRPYRQQVAVKVLERRGSGDELVRRFEQERQILASLGHPDIARLLDGGLAADGRPWLAMEYIDGRPIDRYCDEERLTVPERIQLFRRVAAAVHDAHRNLIVHRDLKPSNIVVDAEGRLKLLDFGIAKLLATDDAPYAAPPTRTDLRLMTPEYASPEQVRGDPVTTASDVYQLGLLLYQLLSGRRPYRLEGAGAAEIERIVCDQDPPHPATAVTGPPPGPDREDIVKARRTTLERLRRQLRGDLGNIVMMALRKEPERRYASVDRMLEDLRRWREGLPVAARPDTITYRVRRFAGRHRTGVTAAAALLLLLLAYAATVTLQARQVARERDRARAEATKAREVTAFLTELFQVADPHVAPGEEITARELLERGKERIQRELAGQPRIQAEMLRIVGEIQGRLGLYEDAEPLLRRALELAREQPVPDSSEVAGHLVALARVLQEVGQLAEAEELLAEALALRRRLHESPHPEVAEALHELGEVALARGDLEQAGDLGDEALSILDRTAGEDGPLRGSILNLLGRAARDLGNYEAAEAHFRQALELRRRILPPGHPQLSDSAGNLALLLRTKGDYAAAEPLYREVVSIKRAVLGDMHPDLAMTLGNLAALLRNQGRFAEAESLHREALAMRRRTLGEEHPLVAMNFNDLGRVLQDRGDREGADAAYREALSRYGPEHHWRSATLYNLATLRQETDRHREAEGLIREAIARDRARLGNDHPLMGLYLTALGVSQHALEDPTKAEESLRAALEVFRAALPPDHPWIAEALRPLGELLLETGRAPEAEPLLREAVELRIGKHGEEDWRTARARLALGRCLLALGREGEAEPLLLKALRSSDRLSAEERRDVLAALTRVYESLGDEERAARYRAEVPPVPVRSPDPGRSG